MSLPNLTLRPSGPGNRFIQLAACYGRPAVLPLLVAIIPSLYHYSNNVENLTLPSLGWMLLFNAGLALLVYLVFLMIGKFQAYRAAHAAFFFLILFNVYGLVYRHLLSMDVIRVRHYTLLPLTLMMTVYLFLFLSRVKESVLAGIWKSMSLIVAVLVLFNLLHIVPAEAGRWTYRTAAASLNAQKRTLPASRTPDIYYIVFDEFSGFQAMREYWDYDGVDDFAGFLKDRGFFVAEASRGSGKDTLRELATRLNYRRYPFETSTTSYFNEIADNRVMRYLKALGYATVVFDERKLAYPSAQSIHADYVYEYGSPAIPQTRPVVKGLYLDEFGELVINNTMLYPVAGAFKKSNPQADLHTNMISFVVESIDDEQVPSPKFVYVHLLLPHLPFMFDRNGELLEREHFTNWNYYLETYIYTMGIARQMVDSILKNADPANPPVIILQSDHGVRNESAYTEGVIFLTDYPEEYKTSILNAMYIPGYDYSGLPQDIDPINTFPLLFNHLFDEAIPLVE